MKGGHKMRNRIILFVITCILIIMHVHVSVCTIGTPANPVHVCLLFAAAGLADEIHVLYICSYVIQSFVTISIAVLLLDYKRVRLWLAAFAVFLPLAILYKFIINTNDLILSTHINAIDQFYERVYDNHSINAFTHIVFFSAAQLLFLATYTVSDYFIRRKKAESYDVISIKSKRLYIVLIILLIVLLCYVPVFLPDWLQS